MKAAEAGSIVPKVSPPNASAESRMAATAGMKASARGRGRLQFGFPSSPHCIVRRALPGAMRRAPMADMRAMTARVAKTRSSAISPRAFP
ncbi:MAG: hypothetical protein BGO06_09435 [Shinella sp. 65-6]|nr:MAG: hypothetical protein BGO06_09435 [Shinella sp. 65-6]